MKSDIEIMQAAATLTEFVEFLRVSRREQDSMPEWFPSVIEAYSIAWVAQMRMEQVAARLKDL